MNSSDIARLVREVLRTVTHGEPDVTALTGSLTGLGLDADTIGEIVDRVRRDRAEVARLRRREHKTHLIGALEARFSSWSPTDEHPPRSTA